MIGAGLLEEAIQVLGRSGSYPSGHESREYLSLERCRSIVTESIDNPEVASCAVLHTYLVGHKERLISSLARVPLAKNANETLLEIGCYGVFLLWARRDLGYQRVVGIDLEDNESVACVKKLLDAIDLHSGVSLLFLDLETDLWPEFEVDHFATIVCFEVLEHLNRDPWVVLSKCRAYMGTDSVLLVSVPNCVSSFTLRQMLCGMPPLTYWFYHPDIRHEPRHSLEYTPLLLIMALLSSGFSVEFVDTMWNYHSREELAQFTLCLNALGFGNDYCGDTIFVAIVKNVALDNPERYPSVLYSGEKFYSDIWSHLVPSADRRSSEFLRAVTATTRSVSPHTEHDVDIAESALLLARSLADKAEALESKYGELLKSHAANEQQLAVQQRDFESMALVIEVLRAQLDANAVSEFGDRVLSMSRGSGFGAVLAGYRRGRSLYRVLAPSWVKRLVGNSHIVPVLKRLVRRVVM